MWEKGARPGHCPNATGVALGDATSSSSSPTRRGRVGQLESLCQALPGVLPRPREAGPAATKDQRCSLPPLGGAGWLRAAGGGGGGGGGAALPPQDGRRAPASPRDRCWPTRSPQLGGRACKFKIGPSGNRRLRAPGWAWLGKGPRAAGRGNGDCSRRGPGPSAGRAFPPPRGDPLAGQGQRMAGRGLEVSGAGPCHHPHPAVQGNSKVNVSNSHTQNSQRLG